MERIFSHYTEWEDYQNGMYNEDKENRSERIKDVAKVLGDPVVCREQMMAVVEKWKKATEYNLSNSSMNRIAWLGQSACCIYSGVHEDETREGWWKLTEEQRMEANNIAREIITKWVRLRERECIGYQFCIEDLFELGVIQ